MVDTANHSDRMRLSWWERPRFLFATVALALGLAIYAVGGAEPEEAPTPTTITIVPDQQVGALTTEDLEGIRVLLRLLSQEAVLRVLTPDERQAVRDAQDLVDRVDDGHVTIAPPTTTTTSPPPRPPTTTTSTTTTTQPATPPPPTTERPLIDLNGIIDTLHP